MRSYRIELRETRMSKDDADDVALFDVTREGEGQTRSVAAFLSPLFRVMHMESQAPVESRRNMVAGWGASYRRAAATGAGASRGGVPDIRG
jgi:hypothetical protein